LDALLAIANISAADLSPQTSSTLFPLATSVAGSIVSGSGGAGDAGTITVSVRDNLSTGGVISTSNDGNAGNITLTSTNGEFYGQLKQAPIKAEALRQAQFATIEGKVRLQAGKLITTRGSFPLPPELAQLGESCLIPTTGVGSR
jgi:hypothetical protein